MKTIKLFVASVLLAFSGNSQYETWQTFGSPQISQGSSNQVKLETGIDPYVLFTESTIGGKLMAKLYDGNNWIHVGPASGISAGNVTGYDLAVTPQNVAYVVYSDLTENGRTRVKRFNGSSWVDLGGLVSAGNSSYPQIEVYNSVVYAAFYNSELSGPNGISIKSFQLGSWVDVGNQLIGGQGIWDVDLEFDDNGTPYISYVNDNSEVHVMKLVGGVWTSVGGITTTNVDINADDVVELLVHNNDPYIAFSDTSENLALTVLSYSGSSWSSVGSAGFSVPNVGYFDLKVAPDGTFYSAFSTYSGNVSASVMKYIPSLGWEYVGNNNFTLNSNITTTSPSLGFYGNSNTPILAYTSYETNFTVSSMAFLPCSETSSTVTVSACESYTSPSGNYTWTESGTYTDTIPNALNCDSIVTVALTIGLDTTVSQALQYLSSNCALPNTTYQWIDCKDSSFIPFETSISFKPDTVGVYAVIITNGNCVDTSACYDVTEFASLKEMVEDQVKVYPNPAQSVLNIEIINHMDVEAMKIINLQGKTMERFNGFVNQVDISKLSSGTYILLVINSEGKSIYKKITKQ